MVAATAVEVAEVGDIPADNLQNVLGVINGKADYAATAAGTADAKATNAQAAANAAAGTAQWAADTAGAVQGTVDNYVAPLTGKMDAEMTQVFAALGLVRS